MNNKNSKTKKTLIVILICAFITIGVTIGITCYNYFGYVNYKINYLTNYFDVNGELGVTVEDKIDRSLMWSSEYYTDDLNVTYRDPKTKDVITSEKVTDADALHVNASIEGNVLHLPNYFDIHLYQMVTKHVAEDGKEEYTLSYYFYFYNINYNTIPDFDPTYVRMTFVNGIGEESDEELQEVLDDFDKDGETGNIPETYSYSIMSENESDTLATFAIYDNPVNVFDEEDDETKLYYIYRNRCNSSADNQTTFVEAKNLTFSVYYLNDNAETDTPLVNILEGTFTAKLNEEGKVYTAEEFYKLEGLTKGYNGNFYQDSYKEFAKPKLLVAALITFGVTAVLCTLFALVWVYEPKENYAPKQKKNKK